MDELQQFTNSATIMFAKQMTPTIVVTNVLLQAGKY